MCDEIIKKIQKAREESGTDYCAQSSTKVELNRRNLQHEGYNQLVSSWPRPLSTWCPRASLYYAYTEEVNLFDRINEFAESEKNRSGDDITIPHFEPPLDPFTIRDPYEENDARKQYLQTDPTCFAIFGKPGVNSKELAKLISEWWKCVLISPDNLINEEIEKGSDKGQWIEEILLNGGIIGPNIIMNLVEARVKKNDVKHKGYVVEGLPLIPDNLDSEFSLCPEEGAKGISEKCCTVESTCCVNSESDSSASESTTSLNSTKKPVSLASLSPVKKLKDAGTKFNLLRNVQRSSSLGALPFDQKTTKNLEGRHDLFNRRDIQQSPQFEKKTSKKRVRINPFDNKAHRKVHRFEKCEDYIPDQVERMFNQWPIKPTVIIYIICSDDDLIHRQADFTFNSFAGESLDTKFAGWDPHFDDKRGKKYSLNRKNDAEATVKLKCEIFKLHALPIIDRYVLKHNPQNVIRVDGRTLVAQMFQIVNTKLRTLTFTRAIIPKRIVNRVGWEADEIFAGEGDEEMFKSEISEDIFEGKSNEEMFQELSKKSTISSRFPWCLSNWKFICPVELAQGRMIQGKAENAVRFMNKIYFLSSIETMEMFLENPRPFLLPMRPKPTCKIAIFGPRCSGKTKLSYALARNFHANVVDIRKIEKGIIDDRIDANVVFAVRKVLPRVIGNLRKRLETERKNREVARHQGLHFWLSEVKQILKHLNNIQRVDSSESMENLEPPDLTSIHQQLQKHGLEFLIEDSKLRERIELNDKILHEYAPENLRFEESPIRELSEHDPEVAIMLENEVKHLRDEKIEVPSSEIAGLLISRIKMMPDVPLENGLLKEPGWILDGMYPDPEIWRILKEADVAVDDLILITEDEPYENLVDNYKQFSLSEEIGGDEDEDEEVYTRESRFNKDIESYINDVREFNENWQNFKEVLLEDGGLDPFVCNFYKPSNLYEIVLKHINDRFCLAAKVITEKERETEFQDSIESATEINENEDLEDEEPEKVGEQNSTKHDNRRLGDTGIYCPVALARSGVFWKGKDEYTASYLDKIYLCSSAEALDEFVRNPEIFNIPFKKPMTEIPPTRIWIVGPPGSGKSTLAKILSKEFNMKHIDFLERLNTYMRDRGINFGDKNKEEELEIIDLPEDLTNNNYNIDRKTIVAIIKKYKKEGATLPQKILEECLLNFFGPSNNFATIFDSFPNCFEDVEIAFKNYAVPELVIELECTLDKTQERLLPGLLKTFEDKQVAKNAKAAKPADNMDHGASEDENDSQEEEDDTENVPSENENDPEEIKNRILQQIEESYHRTNKLLTTARSRIEEESISWIKVNSEKEINALIPKLKKIIQPLIFRKSSILERTFEVNSEIAEDLLECGYYLLSSFGRSCPVQMYNKKIPIQFYLPMEDEEKIITILHRQYIYFIAGEESKKLFTEDPLKYFLQDSCNPLIPAKISIIGPPKSGKSTIAKRFARTYGMRVITENDALRWIKTNYAWTNTGILIHEYQKNGKKISNQLTARAVELYLMDPMSSTQGYVLDGFPTDRKQAEELALLNIRPMIVLNLQADENFCLTSSALKDEKTKENQPDDYFLSLISYRYDNWTETSSIYLDWLSKFTQNVVDIDATRSKWSVWRNADRIVCSRFSDIKRYFREADYEKVHCLQNLSISPIEFRSRQSHYESYCPACLHYDDTIKFSGAPPNKTGIVQFREYFYWICPKHLETFEKNPQACLPPKSTATLPDELPQILNETIDLDHVCSARKLRAGGNCIVTYADALPEYQIVPGEPNLGVLYEDNLYLFSSLECREKFCARPAMYAKIEIKYRATSPSMEFKNLPTVDFLEKTVADAIVKAVGEAAAVRPKYPGMSPALSAAIYIGVYLKVHNMNCALDEVGIYEQVKRRMDARYEIFRIATRNIKKIMNPHVAVIHYPHNLTLFVSVEARRVPVPDARFDYLCEYFKPASKVPAFLNVVDIAGLVKGAAEGQGLGNAFLSHISACDAIFHLCRAFEDDDVTHIEGEVNPVRDLEIISEELRLKDIEFLGVHLEKLEKLVVRGNDKKLKPEYDTVLKVKNILIEEKKHIRFADWSVNEIEILNKYLFLTSKPVIYLVNLSEKDYIRKKNKWLIKIKEWVDKNDPGAILIPFSGTFENKVFDMDEAERAKYFEESKVTSALDKIIVQGYKALQLQYFFTAGADEVKAWTIQKGTKAPQAAGRIHTDFEKGFIMAEVMKFEDFKNEGSESGVKAAGKYRQQGRNYVVEDGDIIFFKFNAGAGLKDPKKK